MQGIIRKFSVLFKIFLCDSHSVASQSTTYRVEFGNHWDRFLPTHIRETIKFSDNMVRRKSNSKTYFKKMS